MRCRTIFAYLRDSALAPPLQHPKLEDTDGGIIFCNRSKIAVAHWHPRRAALAHSIFRVPITRLIAALVLNPNSIRQRGAARRPIAASETMSKPVRHSGKYWIGTPTIADS